MTSISSLCAQVRFRIWRRIVSGFTRWMKTCRPRLAVECDGDKWHGPDHYEADMQRQRQLERCGWEFFRVRESAFYANRAKAMDGLWRALEERGVFPESSRTTMPVSKEAPDDACGEGDSIATAEDEDLAQDADALFSGSDGGVAPTGQRLDEVSAAEIQDAIVRVLANCPNQSCTLDSLTARVLKDFGIITRGNPRAEFEKRVMRSVVTLETKDVLERYRAKNRRVRLV